MNYLKEILAFNNYVQINRLSTGQIALWYALMYFNNKCNWEDEFTVPMMLLILHTGMSQSGIKKAREALKICGLIEYFPNGKQATKYKLNSVICDYVTLNSDRQSNRQSNQQSDRQSNRQRSALNKYKYKQKQNINNNIKKAPLNNYEDGNKTDFSALDEKIMDMMLGEG